MKLPWEDIADRILRNNFGIYGVGNFDLSVKEFSEVLRIAIHAKKSDVDKELNDYYNSIK